MIESKIIEQYTPLIISQLSLYNIRNYHDREDIKQVCYISLLQATRKWDASRNIKFITYATKCIRNAIFKELRQRKYINRLPCISGINIDLVSGKIHQNNLDDLSRFLSQECIDIAIMKQKGYTIIEIAEKYNRNRKWVGRRIKKIQTVLRKYYQNG